MKTNSAYQAPTTPYPSVTAKSHASGGARPTRAPSGQEGPARVAGAAQRPADHVWRASKSWKAAPSAGSGTPSADHLDVVDEHPHQCLGASTKSAAMPTASTTAAEAPSGSAALGGGELARALVAPDEASSGDRSRSPA